MNEDNTLKRTLGLGSLVVFGIAYMSLSTVMTYMGITAQMTHGMIALAFLVAGIAMTFTAFSYSKMVRAFPVAGSAFAYVSNSLNPHVGFMTGWVMMLDYALLGCLSYLLLGLYMNILIPAIPGWAWVIISVMILTIVQYVGVDIMAKVNNILVAVVAIFMIGFFILMLKVIMTGSGFPALFNLAGVYNAAEFPNVGWGGIVQAASILVLCFLGCDAVTTLAEEAIEPRKNVGRAIIIITVGMGIYFVIYSYVMQLVWPTAWQEFVNPDTASEELVTYVGGQVLGLIWTGMYTLTCVTCCLAAQTSATRLLFGMGRDGVFPAKFFAHLHPKFKTPVCNIIFISVLSIIVACFTDLLSISSVINFGALIGFALVNVCVFAHYFIKEKKRKGVFNICSYVIAPVIGALVCIFIWVNLDATALILGSCWTVIGFVYLAVATKGFKTVKKMTFSEDVPDEME